MLGLLGLYKDEHKLKHDNYFKMENRLWRTSKIDPFGSNIAFVLYKYGLYSFIGFMIGEHIMFNIPFYSCYL